MSFHYAQLLYNNFPSAYQFKLYINCDSAKDIVKHFLQQKFSHSIGLNIDLIHLVIAKSSDAEGQSLDSA